MSGRPPYHQPFAEQLAFFRQKLNLPSDRWDSIQRAAHDRGFIVAGAQGADLLADLRGAVGKAIEQGTGLDAFRKDFKAIVARHGWTGWTGEGSKAGVAWRTKVIYQTNMATSYAAGRRQQLNDPDLLKLLPYWQYKHSDSVMFPRPLHVSWNGLTLPPDHPFWKTHFPPNGWGCHCRIVAVSKSDYLKAVSGGKGAPPEGWDTRNDNGLMPGIDKGWDYAPGASVKRPLKDFIDQKLIKLDAPIGAAMWQSIKPMLLTEQASAVRDMVTVAAASMEPAGASVVAYVIAPKTVSDLTSRGIALNDSAVWLRDHELVHALRDLKEKRGAALPVEAWLELTNNLERAAPYLDMLDQALIYAFDSPDNLGKVVVKINYWDRVKRKRINSNFVGTGGVIDARSLNERLPDGSRRYVPLEK